MHCSDVFQGFSVFNFPFLSVGTAGSVTTLAKRWSTQWKTEAIAGGGVFKAFSVLKSFLFKPLRASLAFSTNGRA